MITKEQYNDAVFELARLWEAAGTAYASDDCSDGLHDALVSSGKVLQSLGYCFECGQLDTDANERDSKCGRCAYGY